jgi:hypothetical protein
MIGKGELYGDLETGDKAAVLAGHNNTPEGSGLRRKRRLQFFGLTPCKTAKVKEKPLLSPAIRPGGAGLKQTPLIHSDIYNIHYYIDYVK